MAEREYDVVLFGATGFTGHLVAERLVERAPEGTRIALAGRSLAKLGAVRDALGPAAAHWPLLLADSSNKPTMTTMARSAIAVATTVGPYAKYGLPLVEACAKAGTHYVDLSGEVLFMRASIDAYDEVARGTGARIVHACGFDSIPSDLGVLLLHEVAGPLAETTLLVKDMRGGFSGGTLASGRVQAEAVAADPQARTIAADPYALSPDRESEPDRGGQADAASEADLSSAVHHPELGWIGPFVMGPTNSRVVRRSNALMGFAYSRDFRYQEATWFGEGLSARARATGMTAGLGAFGAAMTFGPTRSGIGKVLPKPGEGPSAEDRAAGRFRMEIHGWRPDGEHFVATVAAQGDPGYAATSLMLAESVLLAASGDTALPDRAGVLTPATGLGMPLVERLRAAGMTFEAGPAPVAAEGAGDPADEEGPTAAGEDGSVGLDSSI
jgi:short subunit dehydrogenase-like uncharacterized protein